MSQIIDSEWHEQLRQKAGVIQRVASSPDGAVLFKLLETTFQSGSMLGKDTQETAYNVGQFELVDYLKTLRDIGVDK